MEGRSGSTAGGPRHVEHSNSGKTARGNTVNNRLGAVVLMLVAGGCGSRNEAQRREQQRLSNETQQLEQQQLLNELAKTNNEKLAELLEKEQAVKLLEEKNHRDRQENERQSAELRVARQGLAEWEGRLESARQQLELDLRQLVGEQEEIAELRVEIERRQLTIDRVEEVKRKMAENARLAEEERRRPEVMARIARREPHLDKLADTLIGLIHASYFSRESRSDTKKELMEELRVIAVIEEEDTFAGRASRVAFSFFKGKTGYGVYYQYEQEEAAVAAWKKDYIEGASRSDGGLRQ